MERRREVPVIGWDDEPLHPRGCLLPILLALAFWGLIVWGIVSLIQKLV